MATEVIMPALGMAQDTGTIVRWLKAEGEMVQRGDPLLEVETDKASVEIEAEADGVLASVTAGDGEVVPVGESIALILAAGEAEGALRQNSDVNLGLAVAVGDGLLVPVIRNADTLTLDELAVHRTDLMQRAQASTLRSEDLTGGTFTISNLGMFGVDAFNAIINAPQAAILAVGRIAERVVPVDGTPAVQPMMTLTLSYDHRVVDGARGALFLDTLVALIEEPLGLLS